ncbi:hypothetical protein IEQ34_013438 [Dendrobium chrysotoxum]|uniref:Uncharacterized protein n=1 Tax=Dendrobium chrysotoxum TaxID=161865 RepID=A0AAV7GQZ4_DENCH|nr:hypothetical protein IEQ34_013438 [Dendrobium chrysotoxum]
MDVEGLSSHNHVESVLADHEVNRRLNFSMIQILEEPNVEEVSLLMDIFGQPLESLCLRIFAGSYNAANNHHNPLFFGPTADFWSGNGLRFCLIGGTEVHSAIISNIQGLAAAFSSYKDEILVNREELLQFAQCAISGLKFNAYLARIDAESSTLWQKIFNMERVKIFADKDSQKTFVESASTTIEALEEALEEVQLCSRLNELLIKKKTFKNKDTLATHNEKIDKLKVLAESLANSSSKAETRISDQRHQLEDALNFRMAKTSEVNETEEGLIAEISGLEKQKDELEAQLNKVTISLKAALLRLHKHREERNYFDEANSQIILHFKAKEDELSKSVASYKLEAHMVRTWIDFLEDTWHLQSSYSGQKEKQTKYVSFTLKADNHQILLNFSQEGDVILLYHELERYGTYLVKLIKHHLLACKNELGVSVNLMKALVDNLKNFNEREDEASSAFTKVLLESNSREVLEQEYLHVERKIITAFIVVDHMKELFYAGQDGVSRRYDPQIEELFNSTEKARKEFGTIERPNLEIENSKERETSLEKKLQKSPSLAALSFSTPRAMDTESPESAESPSADLAKLDSEYGSPTGGYSSEDITEWEL